MWIVKLALRRPYTFVVMALLLVVLGATAVWRMRTDIFPEIDIPVITMIWTYKGMDAEEFEKRVTTFAEYGVSSSVPILQLSVSSDTLSESDVYDYALWRLRTQLSTIRGLTLPSPYGGKERQIMVDLDTQA